MIGERGAFIESLSCFQWRSGFPSPFSSLIVWQYTPFVVPSISLYVLLITYISPSSHNYPIAGPF